MNEARRRELLAIYRDGLLHNTLPFWLSHAVDQKHGGIITAVDRDGTIVDTDKGVWQQGRFAWLLGELFNQVEPRGEWLEIAQKTVAFLNQHGFDPTDGRMWFHLTREGRPIRKRRYAFSEAFAAIAYGELAQATGNDQLAAQARQLFLRFVQHKPEPKFTDVRPTREIGVPMITINIAQQLRDSIQLPEANAWIDRGIEAIRRYHVHDDIACILETVGADGQRLDHFDGRTLNPGHAIEGAWFIIREGQYRNDAELIQLGCRMLDWMWQRGWDQQHGGILYFIDVDGRPIQEYWHDMKFWWPQNETIIATLLAHAVTGDPKYEAWHREIHDWAYRHFADAEHGEWFGYLHRDGSLSSTLKGNLWKGPFHLPRMQLTCWQILESLFPTEE
ncbi:AGE family epimerase/isomerase [Blastopirellula marina]|uniref:N-acylglucosamine 2-epimerase n=1 Tax=Blastopirellula marina TaxID=124 RepID=A0A2S8G8D8_9BACT|nr:AGE family epimerase/isomerase [Blastopirellula marina]PQO40687.1 N-acylglucosamine 2-epimerase [Blastopirellula marina]PTL45647.1 N-acylglucosamine 2-epimerase [Blastopirellula marina]